MEAQQTETPTASQVIESSIEAPNVEQKVAQEAPAVTPKEEAPKEDDSFSRKFAALAKKERELRLKEQEIKEKESKYQSLEDFKKLAKRDINKYLEDSGLTYDEISEFYLNGGVAKDPKIYEIEEKLSQVERELKEKEERRQKAEQEAAVAEFKAKQKLFITTNAEKYELITATGSFDLVYDVCKEYYEKHGTAIENEKAAEMVETYLEKEVEKVLKANKIKSKYLQQAQTKTEKPEKNEKQEIKTLTNSLVSGSSPSTTKPLSRDESIERAAAMLRWK
jgi:hypothetical protein